MSPESESKKDQTLMAWIVVLAVAITCCAILFVVFANYLVTINRSLTLTNDRLTTMESNEAQLLSEIQALHRTMVASGQKPIPPVEPPNQQPPAAGAVASPPSPAAPPAPPPITH